MQTIDHPPSIQYILFNVNQIKIKRVMGALGGVIIKALLSHTVAALAPWITVKTARAHRISSGDAGN